MLIPIQITTHNNQYNQNKYLKPLITKAYQY